MADAGRSGGPHPVRAGRVCARRARAEAGSGVPFDVDRSRCAGRVVSCRVHPLDGEADSLRAREPPPARRPCGACGIAQRSLRGRLFAKSLESCGARRCAPRTDMAAKASQRVTHIPGLFCYLAPWSLAAIALALSLSNSSRMSSTQAARASGACTSM